MSPSPVSVNTPMAVNPAATAANPGSAGGPSGAQGSDPGAFERELQRVTERPAAQAGSADGEAADTSRPAAGKAGAHVTAGERALRGGSTGRDTVDAPLALDPLGVDGGMPAVEAADLETPVAAGEHVDDEASPTDLASWMANLLGVPVAPPLAGNVALPVPTGPRIGRDTTRGAEEVLRTDGAVAAADPSRAVLDGPRGKGAAHAGKGHADRDAASSSEGRLAGSGTASRQTPDITTHALDRPAGDAGVQAVTNPSATPANGATPWPGAVPTIAANAPAVAPPLTDTPLPAALHSPEFAPALGTQIAHFARDGVEHARLQLNPAEMGPIAVQLAMDGQQVRVDLVAELAATRQTLEQSLPALAGALRDAGFTLTGGGVFQQARDGGNPGDGRNAPASTPAPGGASGAAGSALEGRAPSRAARTQGLVDVFA